MSIGVKKKHQHSSNQLLVTQNQRTKQIQSLLMLKTSSYRKQKIYKARYQKNCQASTTIEKND